MFRKFVGQFSGGGKQVFGRFSGSFSGRLSGWFSGSFSEKVMCVLKEILVPKAVWGREEESDITLGASTPCEWFALDRINSEGPFWGLAGSSNPG